MDRFDGMAVLLAVVDRGGFSAAGRALRMPVTTVSRRITDLEDHLGAKLFVRTTRQVSLTEAGVAYVTAARRILGDVEEAEKNAAGEYAEPKGELVITAPIFFGRRHVMPVVEEFLQLHPQITVRLVLLDRNIPLVEDHIDMAVRIGPLADSSMIATRIGQLRTVVCASPRFLEVHGVPSTPEMLRDLPCITFDAPFSSPRWRFHTQDHGLVEVPVRHAPFGQFGRSGARCRHSRYRRHEATALPGRGGRPSRPASADSRSLGKSRRHRSTSFTPGGADYLSRCGCSWTLRRRSCARSWMSYSLECQFHKHVTRYLGASLAPQCGCPLDQQVNSKMR